MKMYLQSIIRLVLMFCVNSVIHGQDLWTIKPEVFTEGQPGEVTCTYNNQFTTFTITGPISTESITSCRINVQPKCNLFPNDQIGYSRYYRLSQTNNSVTVHINSVNRTRDGGQWSCRAFVPSSIQQDENITIDIKVPVSSVEITNKNEDLVKDRNVNLECKSIGGYPLPNITWFIDSRLVNTSVNTATSSLSYQPVVSDQGQRLQCSATNGYGQSQTDSFQLDIKYKPVVDIKPSITPYKLIQGQTFQLECQVNQSNPDVTSYKWYRNGELKTESSSTYTVSNDGSYSCSANNSIGESDTSRVVSVEILYPPTVSTPQSTYSIIESNTLTLSCIATSNPLPNSYTWSGPNNFLQSQQNLTIPGINRNQTGLYTCTVTNIMIPTTGEQQTGTGTGSTTVNVLFGPHVSVSNINVSIKEKENLRISCTVKSNPPTNDISWYQSNGDSVPNQLIDNSKANRRDLVFNDINRTRSDNYTCTARLNLNPTDGNILPQTHSQSSIINVQYFDDIVITINQTKLQENDPVSITCTVDSNPPASIKWFNDSNIELSTSNSNTYFISSTSCLDTGNYSCSATNPVYTNLKTKSFELFVHCSPRLDPRLNSKLNVSGNIGETVELSADIISYPGAEFRWFYKDNGSDIIIENQDPYFIINTNRFINSYRSVLRINITSNVMFRLYYLNVTNDDGFSSDILQFQITAAAAPDIPRNIMFRNITTDTICVEWTPGFNGGASQSFIVQHSTDDKTWVNSSTIPDRTNSGRVDYCIEGLKPDTNYYIRVIAFNRYGESPFEISTENDTKQTTKTLEREGKENVDVTLIGGIVGCVVAVTLILIVVIIIVRHKRQKSEHNEENNSQLVLNDVPQSANDRMIIDVNLDYVSTDDLIREEKESAEDTYASVNKPKKTKLDKKAVDEANLSSSVNKEKKRNGKSNGEKATKPATNMKPKRQAKKENKSTTPKIPAGDAYENVGIFGNLEAVPGNVYENNTSVKEDNLPKKENDDLVYVDLKFDQKPSNKVIKKQADEDKVEYGSIDYGKRGPTPPPSSDSSDNEMDYLPPRQ